MQSVFAPSKASSDSCHRVHQTAHRGSKREKGGGGKKGQSFNLVKVKENYFSLICSLEGFEKTVEEVTSNGVELAHQVDLEVNAGDLFNYLSINPQWGGVTGICFWLRHY